MATKHLANLIGLVLIVLMSSLSFAAPAGTPVLSFEQESEAKTVTLPDGRTGRLSSIVNYEIFEIPRKGLNTKHRTRSFTENIIGKALDHEMKHAREIGLRKSDPYVEAFVVPTGRADHVFGQIQTMIESESFMKRMVKGVVNHFKGSPDSPNDLVKGALAWNNVVRYDPKLSNEDIEKLPSNIKDVYKILGQQYTGKEHIIIGDYSQPSLKPTLYALATFRLVFNTATVAITTIGSGILAPDVTFVNGLEAGALPGLFGAATMLAYKPIAKINQHYADFKFIDKLSWNERSKESMHGVSHEVQSLTKQWALSMIFLTKLSVSIMAVNYYYDLGANLDFTDMMLKGAGTGALSVWSAYGFNKLWYERHDQDENPSHRGIRINKKNLYNSNILNVFVTFGQIAMMVTEGNTLATLGLTAYLGGIGVIGFRENLIHGKGRIPKKYQEFKELVEDGEIKGIKSAVRWVRGANIIFENKFGMCQSVFATAI